ncbi:MAG: hypothetical protein GY799_28820 [Desulfobulbaceae bacterium]|nr:hypothetical protein [Desulfobulbaceae bacterium]
MTDKHGCHRTDGDLFTSVGECGHTDKDADEQCRGCSRSSMDEWDVIMCRVQSGWNWRCNVDRKPSLIGCGRLYISDYDGSNKRRVGDLIDGSLQVANRDEQVDE